MFRQILFAGAVMVCGVVALTGCSKDKTTPPTQPPSDRTVIFTEGFEADLSHWEGVYMVSSMEMYYHMRITADAYHNGTGTHSLTTDSNMTALYHIELPANRVESGTAGVEFYMMAQSLGEANFGVLIGQNPGSSGAVTPAFGIFFDSTDSIKSLVFNSWPTVKSFTTIASIQAGHWYKCKIEVSFSDSTAYFYLDDVLKYNKKIDSLGLMGIDRLLVFRDQMQVLPTTSSAGPKPYYVDDITLYKK